MTVEQLVTELKQRLAEAKQVKEQAYEIYCNAEEDKWKMKMRWQTACQRSRLLAQAISTIYAEDLATNPAGRERKGRESHENQD